MPPQGAIERRLCADMKQAMPVKTSGPAVSEIGKSESADRRHDGVDDGRLPTGPLGRFSYSAAVRTPLDNATLQTLKGWKFQPAMCGAEPVVSDIQVVVSFRLR